MAESVWFDRGGLAFEVEVGTPEHAHLVKLGAVRVSKAEAANASAEPDGSDDGLDDLKLDELRERAADAGLDVSSNARQPFIDALRAHADGGAGDDSGDELA